MVSDTLSKEEIFAIIKKNVSWVARGLGLTIEDGEDLIAEVYLAIGDEPLYRKGNPTGFIIMVIKNRALSRAKSKARNEMQLCDTVDWADERKNTWYETWNEEISEAISKLNIQDRLVLMSVVEGIPDKVVARIIGCHTNTIYNRRCKLREKYLWLVPDNM